MSVLRSKSVPASRTTNAEPTSAEAETSAFPALPQDESTSDHRVPTWVQELATARAGRQSRASSVVSTRTRFSTTTFDDSRSIDIQAGGQTFHISRFGDRIVETTAPPPYSGPEFDELFSSQPEVSRADERIEEHDHAHYHHRHHHPGGMRGGRRFPRRVRIAMPDREGLSGTNDEESGAVDTPSRVLTDEELHQIMLDLPSRLKMALGIGANQALPDHATTPIDGDPKPATDTTPGLEISDHSATTTLTDHKQDDGSAGGSGMRSILRGTSEVTVDPTNASSPGWRTTRGIPYTDKSVQNDQYQFGPRRISGDRIFRVAGGEYLLDTHTPSASARSPVDTEEEVGTITAPTVGDLNELSQVYNRVIRDLDREHRKQLHDRDKELDQLRILLHEKDIVYRQQLKGKDFVIDDLKERLDRFEEALQVRLERARNEVEDLWETRWKEHHQELMEKCGLIKPALQGYDSVATQTDTDQSQAK